MSRAMGVLLILFAILLFGGLLIAIGMNSRWPRGAEAVYLLLEILAALGLLVLGYGYVINRRPGVVIGAIILGLAALGLIAIIVIAMFMIL